MTSRSPAPPPGIEAPARFRPRFHHELVACGLRGHALLGTDTRTLDADDGLDTTIVVRADPDGLRWHRCLRCDAWVPLPPPAAPARDRLPARAEVALPLRGRALRDRFVLRLIAVDRIVHVVALAAVAAAVLVFLADRDALRGRALAVLGAFQQAGVGTGLVHRLRDAFTVSPTTVLLVGLAFAAYAALEGAEAVGLWRGRRWAEYLTLVATSVLLVPELYELAHHATPLKVGALVVNLAVIAYLLVAKRLFGLRGGAAAERARRAEDQGWEALARTAPDVAPERAGQGSRARR